METEIPNMETNACSGIIHIESKVCLNEMVGETFTYVTFKTVLKFVLVKRLKAWVIRSVCAEH